MEPFITEIIPKQNFEIVRDKVGEILFLELSNQIVLQDLQDQALVTIEKSFPANIANAVEIVVSTDNANYGNTSEKSAQGRTYFNVDIYTTGENDDEQTGDINAASTLLKWLGMCRYILQSGKYKRLGFPPGFIGGTYVENWDVYPAQNKEDSQYTRFARLVYSVQISESQNLWDGIALAGTDTGVKLGMTEQGYYYEFINQE